MSYRTTTQEQGINTMIDHYNSEINKTMNIATFRNELKAARTEAVINHINEELYRLFMFRNNLLDILAKKDLVD